VGLEEDVRRDMAGMTKPLVRPSTGGTANLDDLDEEERFRLILARLAGIENAVFRLAQKLDELSR
jgi:hypothetical protein